MMQHQIQTQSKGDFLPPDPHFVLNCPRLFLVEARHINKEGVLEFYVKHFTEEKQARQFAEDYPKIINVTEAGSHPYAAVYEVTRIV